MSDTKYYRFVQELTAEEYAANPSPMISVDTNGVVLVSEEFTKAEVYQSYKTRMFAELYGGPRNSIQ
jgi:hypothetical protein